jgi:thioredoxin-related protein
MKNCGFDSALSMFKSVVFLLVLSFCIMASAAFAEGGIHWYDLDTGFTTAKNAHKMILVDLYTDWCHFCKKLDQNTLSDPQVTAYLNEKFICVKVNAENNREGKKIKNNFAIEGYPCTLVFDQTGTFMGKFAGYTNPSNYKIMVERIISKPVLNSPLNLNTVQQ